MSERLTSWYFTDLNTIAYRTAWNLQQNILEAKKQDEHFPDVVLFLEHHPVFTLGRRGGKENLKVSDCLVKEKGMEIISVERGGDITYHGPGQLVGYPLIHLQRNRIKLAEYVEKLEETMIQTAFQWKIAAKRNNLNRGVWVDNRKLGSIGIAVKRGIAFHGFSLNVDLSLEPYEWINPCGLKNIFMTSMERESTEQVSLKRIKDAVKHHMARVFRINWKPMPFSRLNSMLGVP